jgi:hypothetical protein
MKASFPWVTLGTRNAAVTKASLYLTGTNPNSFKAFQASAIEARHNSIIQTINSN